MATYIILNIVFMLVVLLLLRAKLKKLSKAWAITLSIVLALTAVFDSVIVGLSIVGYNDNKILGIFIGYAPIEDFFYAIFACIIVPVIWNGLSTKKKAL